MAGVNRKYKDTLFRFLFANSKSNALSLYNAVNGSEYTNEDDLEFHTLEDVIYMKFKNDVSFLIAKTLNLYEHQSSYNPNMPLRGFFYYADLYRKLIDKAERLYGKTLVKIPTPNYVVFYNGSEKYMNEDKKLLRLSDAFEDSSVSSNYEWTATMININCGANKDLMEKCKVLHEYSIFVGKVKENLKFRDLEEAINLAVDECIKEDVLKKFLEEHKREVFSMCLTEFDEQEYEDIIREEALAEGEARGEARGKILGREEGRAEGKILGTIEFARSIDYDDRQIIAQLMKQFNLSEEEAESYVLTPVE